MNRRYLPPTDFAFGVQASPASFLSFPLAAWECITGRASERDGGCTPVPTVFDNHCHIFIRQTFRTGLQTPSSHRDCESIIQIRLKTFFTTKARRTRSFQYIELKRLFFFVPFVSFVVNSLIFSKNEYFHSLGSLGTRLTLNLMAVTQSAGTRPQ